MIFAPMILKIEKRRARFVQWPHLLFIAFLAGCGSGGEESHRENQTTPRDAATGDSSGSACFRLAVSSSDVARLRETLRRDEAALGMEGTPRASPRKSSALRPAPSFLRQTAASLLPRPAAR